MCVGHLSCEERSGLTISFNECYFTQPEVFLPPQSLADLQHSLLPLIKALLHGTETKTSRGSLLKAATSDSPSCTSGTPTRCVASLTGAEEEHGAVLPFPSTARGGDEHSAMLLKQVALAGSGASLFHKVFPGRRLAQESC